MNVNSEVKSDKLIITVDLTQDFGRSKSGKTLIIASTQGFKNVKGDISFNLNVCKKTS